MTTEPSRIVSLISAAITATIGLLTVLGVFNEEVGGAITIAAGAWTAVGGEIIRSKVTPTAATGIVLERQVDGA